MKVCWNLTNRCNAKCLHCFRNCEEQSLTLKQNLSILNKLSGVVDGISFSGGEALLYTDFFELLNEVKRRGFFCSITTNATLLTLQNIDKFVKLLDRITFSLDSINDDKNLAMGRGEGYSKHLTEIIKYLTTKYPDFPININTVVTKENFDDIESLYGFLRTKRISTWKIMRFCPYRSIAQTNRERLEISDSEFLSIKKTVENFTNLNINVLDINEIEQQFVISPAGNLITGKNNSDIILLSSLYNQTPENIKTVFSQGLKNNNLLSINLNLYKTFYDVAKAGSISAASKLSYTSQPAISKAIKKIENDLNVKLFNRSLNGVSLTKSGEKLLYYIEVAFNNILTAERSLTEDSSFDRGYLKIGTPSHIGKFFIFDMVKNFRKDFPNIKISIVSRSTKELLELLKVHEIDFIIDAAPIASDTENLTIIPLKTARHCFVTPSQDRNKYGKIKTLFDLQTKPLILPVSRSTHRKALKQLCDQFGVTFNNSIEIETSEMIINALDEGLGIGYVLYDLVKPRIDKGELFEICLSRELPSITIELAYYEEYLTTVPRTFLQKFIFKHNQKL